MNPEEKPKEESKRPVLKKKLYCTIHPSEAIERVCTFPGCDEFPLLCWECAMQKAEHTKEHKEYIIKLDKFLEDREKEMQSSKNEPKIPEELQELMHSSQTKIEEYNKSIDEEIEKCQNEMLAFKEQIIEILNNYVAQVQKKYEKYKVDYEEAINSANKLIQERYSQPPESNTEIKQAIVEKFQSLKNSEEIASYIKLLINPSEQKQQIDPQLSF